MAIEEHLNILLRGVDTWNTWRMVQGWEFKPDLRGIDLSESALINRGCDKLLTREVTLGGANLARINFSDTNLEGANLFRADLRAAHLDGANLSKANLSEANLIAADLESTNLSNSFLIEARLSSAHFRLTKLNGARVPGAHFDKVLFEGVDLRKIALGRINGARFIGCNFRGADLKRWDLRGLDLQDSNFSEAKLNNNDLSYTNFTRCNLSRAHLAGANLYGANLYNADLRSARFTKTEFSGTLFVSTDLKNAINLDTCRHRGRSTLDIDTFLKSGMLPVKFLRGCGLTDIFIEYLPSLLTEPIQFHSCFISYSSKNVKLAERIYTDLQNRGVRCWFAPENLKIGDKTRIKIDESIRLHDKLLLILSKHSVSSDWVEQEVETALERERVEKRTVLFPITVDDAVMEIPSGWPALIRNTRQIGNFKNWERHNNYQIAFNRLIRDLKQ